MKVYIISIKYQYIDISSHIECELLPNKMIVEYTIYNKLSKSNTKCLEIPCVESIPDIKRKIIEYEESIVKNDEHAKIVEEIKMLLGKLLK